MRCEACHGTGFKRVAPPIEGVVLCADCNGCGVAHCCDGLICTPDEEVKHVAAEIDPVAWLKDVAAEEAKLNKPRALAPNWWV